MEATYSSETVVNFHWITWYYTPEDRVLHNYFHENLISYIKRSIYTISNEYEVRENPQILVLCE
jgi:hypothetical protein